MTKFCDRLKQLRREASLTQDELAKNLKITRSRLAMYEQGQRDPDTEVLEAIADYFNVDMDYLLGRTHQKHSANVDFIIENNLDLETLVYMNKLDADQLSRLMAVAKAMFPEVR